jgi:MFS family permease
MMVAVLLGPALAGLTIKVAGPGQEWLALVVDALSFGVSALFIQSIPRPRHAPAAPLPPTGDRRGQIRAVGHELLAELKLLVLNRTILTLASVGGITMLGLGAANVLWLVYLKTTFGFAESDLALRVGVLGLALAGGMTIASVGIGNFLAWVAPKWLIVGGLLGAGLSLAAFGQLRDYRLLLVATVGLGLFVVPINAAVSTLMQTSVPNEQLGKVMGGFTTITDAATIGSMSLAGVLGAALGIPTIFLLSGVICLLMSIATWALLPLTTRQ